MVVVAIYFSSQSHCVFFLDFVAFGCFNGTGVADETGTLEYGQCYVNVHSEVRVGEVVVCKAPSLHPGDVKKLVAVDVPALRALKNCVVFPVKGRRPHSNEISGDNDF